MEKRNDIVNEEIQKENRYAALCEFHSGTPAKRPYFDDWRRMLSCARFLTLWFTVAEERGESIGLIDEKKLTFGVDDGRVKYDGCDIAHWDRTKTGNVLKKMFVLKEEELTWSVTQFLPPELLKVVLQHKDEGEHPLQDISASEIKPEVLLDRYQLPVLLFRLFFGCHPIGWKNELPGDAKEWLQTLETGGTFRFTERRGFPETFLYPYASNRWDIFPDWYREACTFTFTEAMREPAKRIPARSWFDMVNKLCDTYSRVKNEETRKYRHTFVNDDEKNKKLPDCMMVLQTDTGRIFLPPGSKVYKGDFCGEPGSGPRIGETGRMKKHGDAIGIRMSVPWEVCLCESRHPVAPGEIRILEEDMVLLVDHHLGLIR